MKQIEVLTLGQAAHRCKVNHKKMVDWLYSIHAKYNIITGRSGVVKIDDDEYGRYGIPVELLDYYPNIPPENVADKYKMGHWSPEYQVIRVGT